MPSFQALKEALDYLDADLGTLEREKELEDETTTFFFDSADDYNGNGRHATWQFGPINNGQRDARAPYFDNAGRWIAETAAKIVLELGGIDIDDSDEAGLRVASEIMALGRALQLRARVTRARAL